VHGDTGPEAGWYRDPSGRHDHRWWDGTTWTPYVLTLGLRSVDYGDPDEPDNADAEAEASEPDAPHSKMPEPEVPVVVALRPLAAWCSSAPRCWWWAQLLPWGGDIQDRAVLERRHRRQRCDHAHRRGRPRARGPRHAATDDRRGLPSRRPRWLARSVCVTPSTSSDKAARLVDEGPAGVTVNVGSGVWVTIAGR
jgi:hypothetical protein